MADTSKIYLFHNVYGEENWLIETAPENMIAIPFGWTEEAESNRNAVLDDMGLPGITTVPCVVVWNPATKATMTFLDPETEKKKTIEFDRSPFWEEIPFGMWDKNEWNWEKINQAIANI